MIRLIVLICSLAATPLIADVAIQFANGSVVVADGRSSIIRAIDPETSRELWSTRGVPHPRAVVASAGNRIAVADPITNRVVIIESGEGQVFAVAGGPEQPLFLGETLVVLNRDASTISAFRDGRWTTAPTVAGVSALRESNGLLVAYSAVSGEIALHDPVSLSIGRRGSTDRFAADVETDDDHVYFAVPASRRIIAIDLATLKTAESFPVGAVPVDIALGGRQNALSAGMIAVADPSSRRVWRLERTQTQRAAFFRAFVRSFAGLPLFRASSASLPAGVDRVFIHGRRQFAFDEATGTLYDISSKRPIKLTTGVRLREIAFSSSGDAFVLNGSSLQRLRG